MGSLDDAGLARTGRCARIGQLGLRVEDPSGRATPRHGRVRRGLPGDRSGSACSRGGASGATIIEPETTEVNVNDIKL